MQVELMLPSPERDDMLESLAELRYMVSETLAFVRGESVDEPLCQLSLTELLDDLVRRYRNAGQALTWSLKPDDMLLGRPIALKRAFTNLIDNALRHGGDATISVHLDEQAYVRVEILDHGPGLPPELLEQVFEPFVQIGTPRSNSSCVDTMPPQPGGTIDDAPPPEPMGAFDATTRPVGLGLGLAIARAAVQSHGGELILENRPPAGLCAVMRLPRSFKS